MCLPAQNVSTVIDANGAFLSLSSKNSFCSSNIHMLYNLLQIYENMLSNRDPIGKCNTLTFTSLPVVTAVPFRDQSWVHFCSLDL